MPRAFAASLGLDMRRRRSYGVGAGGAAHGPQGAVPVIGSGCSRDGAGECLKRN